MPILPILTKMFASALSNGAVALHGGKALGAGFIQDYTKGFFEGVKGTLNRSFNGTQDGRTAGSGLMNGIMRSFDEMPKEIGKRRWGEHMAGALVKVTSQRLAAMNASLAMYGGSAQTYAGTMTSLADKAFRLQFGEAGWISQVMKYTMGAYNPFGSGPNGMKTKEENLEWFKDRYNGRKDLVDEARMIGGTLGISPDMIKAIIDGHRELLDKGSHLTEAQIKDSADLQLQTAKTQAKWQEVADLWGAKTADFWTMWEAGKEKMWSGIADILRKERTDEDAEKYLSDGLLTKLKNIADGGSSALDKNDVASKSIWKALDAKGFGKGMTDEQAGRVVKAIAATGYMSEGQATERFKMMRNGKWYMMDVENRLDPASQKAADDLDFYNEGVKSLKPQGGWQGFWRGLKEDSLQDPFVLMAFLPKSLGASEGNFWDMVEGLNVHAADKGINKFDKLSRRKDLWEGIRLKYERNFDRYSGKHFWDVEGFASPDDEQKFRDRVEALNQMYNTELKLLPNTEENREKNRELLKQHMQMRGMGLSNEEIQELIQHPMRYAPRAPSPSSTGLNPYQQAYYAPQAGDKTFTNSPTVVVKSVAEGLEFVRQGMEDGRAWLDGVVPATYEARGDFTGTTTMCA